MTQVTVPLQDVLHTFGVGHRVMVQVQSTWFPLVDLNPQAWVESIYAAQADDFVAAQHRVYRDGKYASGLRFGSLAPLERGGDQAPRCISPTQTSSEP